MAGVPPEEEFKLIVTVEAFKFGQAVRYFADQNRKVERDLKVEGWTKYRDGLPRRVRRDAVVAYRTGYGET